MRGMRSSRIRDQRGRFHDMFEVVEDEQELAVLQKRAESTAAVRSPTSTSPAPAPSQGHEGRIPDRGQGHERDTVGEVAASSAATCKASRVFPIPPGPMRVRSGTSSRRRKSRTSASSRVRPMSHDRGSGSFDAPGVRCAVTIVVPVCSTVIASESCRGGDDRQNQGLAQAIRRNRGAGRT